MKNFKKVLLATTFLVTLIFSAIPVSAEEYQITSTSEFMSTSGPVFEETAEYTVEWTTYQWCDSRDISGGYVVATVYDENFNEIKLRAFPINAGEPIKALYNSETDWYCTISYTKPQVLYTLDKNQIITSEEPTEEEHDGVTYYKYELKPNSHVIVVFCYRSQDGVDTEALHAQMVAQARDEVKVRDSGEAWNLQKQYDPETYYMETQGVPYDITAEQPQAVESTTTTDTAETVSKETAQPKKSHTGVIVLGVVVIAAVAFVVIRKKK